MPRSPKIIKKSTSVTSSTVTPPPSVTRPSVVQPPQPIRLTSSTTPPSSSSRPIRQAAIKALEIMKERNKADSETEGDDSDWSVNEDGVDDDLAECLYDFFKDEKKSDKVNSDVYSYILNVMEDRDEYDPDSSKIVKLKALLPAINVKFRNYYREVEEGGKAPELTMKLLEKYMEAGLDDDYEDDGWIVNDI
jgi:hypothetical protein